MYFSGRVTAVCSNQREKTETTDGQIQGRGLTDESIRDGHIIYYSRFMNTSRLKIQFVSLRQ
jgi:hypothetical protein